MLLKAFKRLILNGLAVCGLILAVRAAAQESYTLNIYNEGGGKTVLMQDLIDLIHTLSAGADVKWDLSGGILQIQTDTQAIQVLSRVPAVIINGRQQSVSRPVLVRQEGVYIPIETVKLVFGALGINFDIQDEGAPAPPAPTPAATPAPTATPTPTPVVPAVPVPGVPLEKTAPPSSTPTPAVPTPAAPLPTPMATATPRPTPALAAPATTETEIATAPGAPAVPIPRIQPNYQQKPASPAEGGPAPLEAPLEAPPALAGRLGIGLTWSQLADLVHRTPPRRVTIVLDAEMRAIGDALTERLRQEGLETSVVAVNNSRRDSEGLVSRVAGTQPELVLDLVSSPLGGENVDGGTYRIWTAHEALWPRDRETGRPGAAADESARYRRHQFQSLALGSLLKYYLAAQFTTQDVEYELAPSYLLRRMDAPSATILVPSDESGEQRQKLIEAIAATLGAYVRGMSRFARG